MKAELPRVLVGLHICCVIDADTMDKVGDDVEH
jgi:hypothetical protein